MEFTAEMIAGLLSGEVVGNKDASVYTVASIEGGKVGGLSYLSNPKYEQYLYTTACSVVLVPRDFIPKKEVKATLIKVEDVGRSVLSLLEMYNAMKPKKVGISRLASISEQATIGKDCYIGDFVVIEAGAVVGDGAKIYAQCYVGDNVKIGAETTLYAGVKIYEGCQIGSRCIIHAGAVIGADGFGFAPKADGTFDKIPQLGNVIIEDDVEVGANTCIDRAKTDSTMIRHGVKLDNLIQIGHNVEVGANTVSSAQTGIAGTSKIGHNCFLAGQVGVADHVTVGNNVKIASKSGIDKDVADGEIRFGYPSLPGMQYHRSFAVFKMLPDLRSRVDALERELKNRE